MKPVLPPTRLGEPNWPTMSAVCLHIGGVPAEFVVTGDCGQPPPAAPYGKLRVRVWPNRTVADQGEFTLTFVHAQRHMLQRVDLLPRTVAVL